MKKNGTQKLKTIGYVLTFPSKNGETGWYVLKEFPTFSDGQGSWIE